LPAALGISLDRKPRKELTFRKGHELRVQKFCDVGRFRVLRRARFVADLTRSRLSSGEKLRRFRMSLQGHIVELQRRHDALKKEIEQEQLHPQSDELKILELKRKKLQIKDELAKLSISETRH
jgi:hypothetical protein